MKIYSTFCFTVPLAAADSVLYAPKKSLNTAGGAQMGTVVNDTPKLTSVTSDSITKCNWQVLPQLRKHTPIARGALSS